MMLANIALSIYLAGRVGISGVVWGSVFAQLLFILIPDAHICAGSFRDARLAARSRWLTDGSSRSGVVTIRLVLTTRRSAPTW